MREALPCSEKTYDGLYRITRAWREEGKDGFLICRHAMQILFNAAGLPARALLALKVYQLQGSYGRVLRYTCGRGCRCACMRRFCMVPIPGHSHVSEKVLAKPEKVSRNQR